MLGRILVAIALLIAGFGAGYLWLQTFGERAPTTAQPTLGGYSEAAPRTQSAESVLERAPAGAVAQSGVPRVATLAETAEINSEFLQSAALYQLAAPLNANGIRKLLDEAKSALVGGDYQGATALLIGRYAELDFAAALDYATNNNGKMQVSWLRAIFHARARIDIDDALQQAQTLSQSQRQVAGVAMLRSTSDISQSQRRAIVDALQIPGQMLATAQFDSADAWQEVKNIENPMQRISAQAQVLMSWAQSDPWAAIDASAEIENEQMLQGVQAQLLALAAADDSQRAMDWVNAQPSGERRDQLMSAIVAQIGKSDPAQAEVLLAGLPEQKRIEAEMSLWTQRAASDPEGAAAWVAGLPEENNASRFSAYSRLAPMQVLSMLGFSSPEAADRFMAALPEKNRSKLGATYVQTMARSNPEQASDWIEAQPSDATPELYTALGSTWSQSNTEAAQEYARGMGSGIDRDSMYTGIMNSGRLSSDDLETIVEKIDDPKLRQQAEQMQQLRRVSRSGLGSASSAAMFRALSGSSGVSIRSTSEAAGDSGEDRDGNSGN